MNIYIEIAGGGLLGAFIHTMVKVNAINRRLNTTNYRQVFSEYWKTDWALFILSLVGITTLVFISSEWLNLENTDEQPKGLYELLQYKVAQFAKTTAVVLGYCVDSAVNAFLGGTERKLIKKAKEEGYEMEQIIKTKKDE